MLSGALPSALKWTEATSSTYCINGASTVSLLIAGFISIVKGHTLYNIFYFFNKNPRYRELVRKFCFILHKVTQRPTAYPLISASHIASPKWRIVKESGKHKGHSS
jgi:hypothetical protein